LGGQGLERLFEHVFGLCHRLAWVPGHTVRHPFQGKASQAPWGDQVQGGHARGPVGSLVVRQRQHEDELVPVDLVVPDVVHEHVHERLVTALDMAIGLRVLRRRVRASDAHKVARTVAEQGGELGSVVPQDRVRGAVHGNPVPEERRRDVRRVDASQGDGSFRLREPVDDHREEAFPCLCLFQRTEEVLVQVREGIRRPEKRENGVCRLGDILLLVWGKPT